MLLCIGSNYVVSAQTYFIKSVVGAIDSNAVNGDSLLATSTVLHTPSGVAVDDSGNIYIADTYNNLVRRVNHVNYITTIIAGNGTAGNTGDNGAGTSAALDLPSSVAVDNFGNVYFVDSFNFRIRKIDLNTGVISAFAGNGNSGYAGDGSAATSASMSPVGVAVDHEGNVYITGNNTIRVVDHTTGIITKLAGIGIAGYSGDNGPALSAKLNEPFGLAVDDSDNIFVADAFNDCIREINHNTGIITTVAGNGMQGYSGDGGLATDAKLNQPTGVTVDDSDNVFIGDLGDNRIRKVDHSTGVIHTIAGTGTGGFTGDNGQASLAELAYPQSLAIDSLGNILVADKYNNRIRKLYLMSSINVNASDTAICLGDSVQFTSEISGDSSFTWTFPGGIPNTSNLPNPHVTYLSSGTYTATLHATNFNGADSISKTIAVHAFPIINIEGNDTIISGSSDTLSASGANSYAWSSGSTADTAVVHPTNMTIYSVIGTDDIGCMSTDSFTVVVNEANGLNEIFNNSNRISLFPNPVKNHLFLKFNDSQKIGQAFVKILTTNGKLIFDRSLNLTGNKPVEINISNLLRGIYLVNIYDANQKEMYSSRFIKY